MVSLGAVLGVVWVVQRRLARGAQKERAQDAVRVISKRGIAPKAQVAVVEVDGIRYVLGVAEGSISVLDRIEPVAPAAVAPVTVLPTPAATRAERRPVAPADDSAPLRRRTHQQTRAAARATRSTSLSTFLQKDAVQVLRRSLGA